MYALIENIAFVVIALVLGGFSFVTLATFLVIKEGFDAASRGSRAR